MEINEEYYEEILNLIQIHGDNLEALLITQSTTNGLLICILLIVLVIFGVNAWRSNK